jgi:RNA polymerase sigma factor (sigma-70 family)
MWDMSDRQLWAAVQKGNGRAYGILFDRHSGKVYNYCFRRTADWAIAQDVMAATFLEAWRRRDLPATEESVLPLLLGVATNLLRNQSRSLRRYRGALNRLPVPPHSPDHADEVAARVDDERAMASLLHALEQLKPRERDVLALTVWSELTYEQTALALGIPVGTVASTVSRAKEKIARTMEADPASGHYQGSRVPAVPAERI